MMELEFSNFIKRSCNRDSACIVVQVVILAYHENYILFNVLTDGS